MTERLPQDTWTIQTAVAPSKDGVGLVTVHLTNGLTGTYPPLAISVDWKQGMEPVDVEVFALAIMGGSLRQLADDCLTLAGTKMKS
ncbi:hypothetical protein ACFPIF_02440 [Brevundimonas faecalis]|uniref:hypothetical protein n=1 Tax=Brevundimonas faecalis TaxID=947378 RepID=UPI003615D00E